jgi:hypothetical protein
MRAKFQAIDNTKAVITSFSQMYKTLASHVTESEM